MSLETIEIQRKLPIINGFVQPPDGQLTLRNSLDPVVAESAIDGSFTRQISGNMRSDREWYILPPYEVQDGAPEDWFAILRSAAT
jgi:hypothetical protein